MTKRERYLKALRNEPVDTLVWAPNFDYWLFTNRARKTMPPAYTDMSRNDIVRAIGGYIWNRATGLQIHRDASIRDQYSREVPHQIHEIHTPVGTIREVSSRTESEESAMALTEHFVKDLESLRVMKYVVEGTSYSPDYQPTYQALHETGDDGVVLNSDFCVPFIQFAKTDAGYMKGFYLWVDHKQEVDELIGLYFKQFIEGYRILADGPADIIATGDNMDGVMISPDIFKEYAMPFYQEVRKVIHPKGKLFEGHWCGRTQTLLPLVPDCGLDIVEAIVTKPMADIDLAEALDLLQGKVVLQGGIPSVLVCKEGGTRQSFERYVRQVILPQRGRKGFILGMSDNVPPNADFSRIESVAEMIKT